MKHSVQFTTILNCLKTNISSEIKILFNQFQTEFTIMEKNSKKKKEMSSNSEKEIF